MAKNKNGLGYFQRFGGGSSAGGSSGGSVYQQELERLQYGSPTAPAPKKSSGNPLGHALGKIAGGVNDFFVKPVVDAAVTTEKQAVKRVKAFSAPTATDAERKALLSNQKASKTNPEFQKATKGISLKNNSAKGRVQAQRMASNGAKASEIRSFLQKDAKALDKQTKQGVSNAVVLGTLDAGGGIPVKVVKKVAARNASRTALKKANADAIAKEAMQKKADKVITRVPNTRLIGPGKSTAQSRISEIDKELAQYHGGVPSKFVPETKSLAAGNLGNKTRVAGKLAFEKNKVGGAITTGKKTTGATFASESGKLAPTKSPAELRALLRERKQLQDQLDGVVPQKTAQTSPVKVTEHVQAPKPPQKLDQALSSIAEPAATSTKREGARFTKHLITTTGLMSRHGAEGKALASKVNDYYHTSRTLATKWSNKIHTVAKLNKHESTNFALAVQGKTTAANAKVAKAVSEWKALSPEIRQSFIKHSGSDIGNIENYFPRAVKSKFLKKDSKGYNAAIQHLLKTKQVKNAGEAKDILDKIRKFSVGGDLIGSFKYARKYDLPADMYDTSKNTIANYLEGAAHNVAGAKHLGLDKGGTFKTADQLIGQLSARGGNGQEVKHAFEQAMRLKNYNETASKVSSIVRGVNVTTKLGLGALTNSAQTANTIIKNGYIDTLKGLGYLSTKNGRKYARETGAFSHGLISDLRDVQGILGPAAKIGAPGFNSVEKFNRYLAAASGKFHAERLAAKGGTKLTKEELLMAGRKSSDITQFDVSPHKLPGWASSPVGKLVSQFQSFSYNQTSFVANEILKPLAKGNPAPFIRLLSVMPAGYGIYQAKSKLRGKDTSGESAAMKVLNAWNAVGGGGTVQNLISSTQNAVKYSKSGSDLITNEASGILGPTVGTGIQTTKNIYSAAKGNSKGLKKQGLQTIPVVGPTLANKFSQDNPTLTTAQSDIVSQAPQQDQRAYAQAFAHIRAAQDSKKNLSNKIRTEIANKNFAKAKRLSDEHNAEINKQIQELTNEVGSPPHAVIDYIRSNYLVDYNYYVEHPTTTKKKYF